MTNLKGLTIEIGGDTTKLQTALKDVEARSNSLNKELKDVDRLLKFNPENTQLLAQKQKILAEQIETTAKKIDTLKEAERQVNEAFAKGEASEEQVRQIQRAVIETSSKLDHYKDEAEKAATGVDKLGDESKEAGEDVEKASRDFSGATDKIKKIGAAIGAATAAIGAAATAAGKKLFEMSGETAQAGDEIDKTSQKLGMSAETYQEWDYVLGQSGVEILSMTTGLKTFTNQIGKAKSGTQASIEMFSKLGISMSDLESMSREDIFGAAIKGLQGMEDGTERAVLANKLFGKSGQELTPLFNQTAESTEELMKTAHDLGFVMSNEAVSASAAYQDSLDTLTRTFSGVKNRIMSDMLPGLTSIMDGLSGVITGQEDASESIKTGASEIVGTMATMVPELLNIVTTLVESLVEVAPSIIQSLIDGILNNLPSLMSSALTILMTLVDTLLDNLPKIIETAGELLVSLCEGISKALPSMLPTIIQVIITMTTMLLQNVDKIIACAGELITGLVNGLIAAIPVLVKNIPTIVSALVNGLASGIGQLGNVGKNLVEGLWNGISDMTSWIIGKIQGFGSNILDGIKSFFGIHSPSTVMNEIIGKNLALGIAEGLDENADAPLSSLETLTNDMLGEVDGLNVERYVNFGINGNIESPAMPNYGGMLQKIYEAIVEGKEIFIDGNKLVGATKDRMNEALGQSLALTRRGATT